MSQAASAEGPAPIAAAAPRVHSSQEQGHTQPALGQPSAVWQHEPAAAAQPSFNTSAGQAVAPEARFSPQHTAQQQSSHAAQPPHPAQPHGDPPRPPGLTYISYPAAALPASQGPSPRPPAGAPPARPAGPPQGAAAAQGLPGAAQQVQPVVRANRPLSVTLSQAQPHLAQSPRPRVPAGPTTPMQPQLGSAIPALPTPMAQIPVLPRELPARTSSPATENPPPNDPNVFTLTDRKVRVLPAEEDMAPYTLCRRWIQNMPYKDLSHTPPAGAGPPHPELLKPEAALKPPVQPLRPSLPPLPPAEPSSYDGSPPQVPDLPHQSAYQGEVPVEVLLLHHERHWARLRVLHRQKAAHRLRRYHTRLAALMQPSHQLPAPAPAPGIAADPAAGPAQSPGAADMATPAADTQRPPIGESVVACTAASLTANTPALPVSTAIAGTGPEMATSGATLIVQ